MRALSVDASGRVTDVELSYRRSAEFRRDLRAVIGCETIEALSVADGLKYWLDENGIAAGCPVNEPASLLAQHYGVPATVRGTVVVTGFDEYSGRARGLVPAQAAELRRLLGVFAQVESVL